MAKFYTPEQWGQLSDEDKKAFFKGIWPEAQAMADGGMVQEPIITDEPVGVEAPAAAPALPPPGMPDLSLQGVFAQPIPPPPPLGSAQGNLVNEAQVPSVLPQQAPSQYPTITTTKTTRQAPIPGAAGMLAQADKARGSQLAALKGSAEANIQEAKDTETILKGFQQKQAGMEVERQKKEQERQVQLAESQSKVDKMIEESKNLRVDPNKFYADRGVFSSLIMSLASGVGAYSAGKLGGKNFAGEALDRAIDRDIDAQKANIEQKSKAVGQQMNLYQMMRSRFGDEREAELATKVALRESVIDSLKIAQATAAAKNAPFAQAKLLADEEAKQVADKVNLVKAITPQATTETIVQESPKARAQYAPGEFETKVAAPARANKLAIEAYDNVIDKVKSGKVPTGRIASFVQETQRMLANAADKDYDKVKAERNRLLFEMASGISGAAYSEKELARFEEIIPKMGTNPKFFKEQMEHLRDQRLKQHEGLLKTNVYAAPAGFDMGELQVKPTKDQLQKKK